METKKSFGIKQIKCLGFVFLFVFAGLNAGYALSGKKAFNFGLYAGYSFGVGDDFEWHIRPYSDRFVFDFHGGTYLQYNITENFGLQLDVNLQLGTHEWELDRIPFPPQSGEEIFSVFLLTLNGVVDVYSGDRLAVALLGGGGLMTGDWWEFDNWYYKLNVGPVLKIYLSPSKNKTAVIFGGTFNYIIDREYGEVFDAVYFKLYSGIEF